MFHVGFKRAAYFPPHSFLFHVYNLRPPTEWPHTYVIMAPYMHMPLNVGNWLLKSTSGPLAPWSARKALDRDIHVKQPVSRNIPTEPARPAWHWHTPVTLVFHMFVSRPETTEEQLEEYDQEPSTWPQNAPHPNTIWLHEMCQKN